MGTQRGSFEDLRQRDVPIPPAKPTEVLVKTHAVSLQVRLTLIHLSRATNPDSQVSRPDAREPIVRGQSRVRMSTLVLQRQHNCFSSPDDLVPCSDMAGEIIAVGDSVSGWQVGDRVCANFALDHVYGDVTPAIGLTALGGFVHGVLTQYRTFPAHVGLQSGHQWIIANIGFQSLVAIPNHLSYEEASTLPWVFSNRDTTLSHHSRVLDAPA